MNPALRSVFRFLLISGAVLAVLVVAAIGLLWFFVPDISDMCRNEIISEIPSPEGKLKVVVFQRDCGATTGFSTQVSILSGNQLLENEGGNLFISDTDHGAAPSGPGGGPALAVTWQNENSVRMSYHQKTRVFKQESTVGGASVSYSYFEDSAQHGAPGDAPKAARP